MTGPSLALAIVVGVAFASGVALLLERSLTRVVLGVVLISNGTNLLVIAGARSGGPPIVGLTPEREMSDPLAQALVLTAIVITLGITVLLLAVAYRNWQFNGDDEVQDDPEDRRLIERAKRYEGPEAAQTAEEAGDVAAVRESQAARRRLGRRRGQ